MRAEEVWLKEQLELVPKDKSASEDSPARKIFHDPVSQNRGSNWISWLFWWILGTSDLSPASMPGHTANLLKQKFPHLQPILAMTARVRNG